MDNLSQRPEVSSALALVQPLESWMQAYHINNDAEYVQAAEDLKRVKAAQKQIDTTDEEICGPLYRGWKNAKAFFTEPRTKLEKIEKTIKAGIDSYQKRLDAQQKEAQRKADELAAKERQKLQARAEKAVASGKAEKAATLAAQAQTIVAPVVQIQAPKVAGLTSRKIWTFRVVDETLIPREYLKPDLQMIGQVAKAMKEKTNIPGIEAFEDSCLGSTSK
jgi:hypothetical protein